MTKAHPESRIISLLKNREIEETGWCQIRKMGNDRSRVLIFLLQEVTPL